MCPNILSLLEVSIMYCILNFLRMYKDVLCSLKCLTLNYEVLTLVGPSRKHLKALKSVINMSYCKCPDHI